MSAKQYYHDIDLLNVGQLVGSRAQNLTAAEITALAATLGAANEGLVVWNSTEKYPMHWTGTEFIRDAVNVEGDLVYKGVVDASQDFDGQTSGAITGYQYSISVAGTLTSATRTFVGDPSVEVGDVIIFISETEVQVLERNNEARLAAIEAKDVEQDGRLDTAEADIDALEARADAIEAKNIEQDGRLSAVEAKDVEQDGRLDSIEAKDIEQDGRLDAVEAKDVEQDGRLDALEANTVINTHYEEVTIVAGTPLTITHNLGLANPNGFVIRTAIGNSDISLDVDAVDANSLTLASLVGLSGVSVYVLGN